MYENLTLSDIQCPICLDIYIKPITLPCEHSFCEKCLKNSFEYSSFSCPKCRKFIGAFFRRNKNCHNEHLWNAVKSQFSEQVLQKQNGEDTGIFEYLNITDLHAPVCNPGEIKEEYHTSLQEELEKEKIRREKEEEASMLLVKQLQEEENRLEEERRKQMLLDENLARIFEQENVQESKTKSKTNHDCDKPPVTRSQTKSASKALRTPKASTSKTARSLESYFKSTPTTSRSESGVESSSVSRRRVQLITSTPKSALKNVPTVGSTTTVTTSMIEDHLPLVPNNTPSNSRSTINTDHNDIQSEQLSIQSPDDPVSNGSNEPVKNAITNEETGEDIENLQSLNIENSADLLNQSDILIRIQENLDKVKRDRLVALQVEKEWLQEPISLRKRLAKVDSVNHDNKKKKMCTARKCLRVVKAEETVNKQKTLCSVGCTCNK